MTLTLRQPGVYVVDTMNEKGVIRFWLGGSNVITALSHALKKLGEVLPH